MCADNQANYFNTFTNGAGKLSFLNFHYYFSTGGTKKFSFIIGRENSKVPLETLIVAKMDKQFHLNKMFCPTIFKQRSGEHQMPCVGTQNKVL